MESQIVFFLKKAEGYISGEEISRSLNISRAGIWKHIQDLRKKGYDIIAVPHLGYKLNSSPDKLFPGEVQYNLGTKLLGRKIVFFENVNSTMDEAFRIGLEETAEGTVILAEGQNCGRGRLGRTWTSPRGKGVYLSVVLKPQLPPNEVPQLTLLTAVAVVEAIKSISGVTASIKWPNDLLVGGQKCAGILTELNAETDRVKFIVVGIGINVNTGLNYLPAGATSLKAAAKRNISRVELTKEILRRIEKWYFRFQKEGFRPVIRRWKDNTTTLNRRIRISDTAGITEGIAVDIDEDGGLLIRQDSGIIVKRIVGDVILMH